MKKFLTVLLVIAVMFTFSFSSAFATVAKGTADKDVPQMAIAWDFYMPEGNADAGTLGVTTETRENILDNFDEVIDGITGFDPAYDYVHYYGTIVPVENALTTSYAGKALTEFKELVAKAKIVANAITKHDTTSTNLLKGLVVGEAIYDVAASGLPTVVNEYTDVLTGKEYKDDFMSNAEAKALKDVWEAAKAKAEVATTAADMQDAYDDAVDAANTINKKYVAYEKQIVKYAKVTPNAKLTDGMYLLPNYGRFVFNGLNKNYSLALGALTPNEQHAVIAWLLDNGYTTKASFEEGTAKLVEALVPYKTWSKDYSTDLNALAKKIANVNQSAFFAKSTETKLADVTALYDERDAFVAKYAVTQELLGQIAEAGIDLELVGVAALLQKEVADTVVEDYDAIKALNKVRNTMSDEEKAEAIALASKLYANFNALYKNYSSVIEKIYPVKASTVDAIAAYNDAYTEATFFKELKAREAAKAAYDVNLATVLLYAGDLEAFKLLARVYEFYLDAEDGLFGKDGALVSFENIKGGDSKEATTATDLKFNATTSNIEAIADAEEAVEEFFATYGGLVSEFSATDEDTEYLAGKLLAAKYNEVLFGIIDPQPTAAEKAAAQAILDNATVKVTTQALGNGKIRVQAKLDNDTWAYIKGDADNKTLSKAPKYTVEYKFYKKKAADKKYKGYSDKTVNYTVFKKLTKGTKYNFRCAVTLKDANGNVVATRPFTGSTKGTRTAK